ncbi:MAG TPA: L,D-transpeptidase family protein [Candidatus Saccharimonadia bacterium]|nr:L,D-transpeptidase family protein [Candidatus Saccharimonadia bacterium]
MTASTFRLAIVLALVAASLAACGERTLKETATNVALQQQLSAPPDYAEGDRELWNAVRVAYRHNGGALLWLDDRRPREQALLLRSAIADASIDGLDPLQYDVRALDGLEQVDDGLFSPDRYLPAAAADADARLTYAAAAFVRDLHRGRVAPSDAGKNFVGARRELSIGKLVHAAANSRDVATTLRRAAPLHPQYAKWRDAHAQLRARAAQGGWPQVPASAVAKSGTRNPDLAPLRERLAASGHYVAAMPADPAAGQAHDAAALRDALTRFQREHGLEADGIPGKATIAALNVPIEDRIRQIEINLERMRWLAHDLGETHILVNLPTFHLEAIEDGRKALEMRVVAGKRHTPTPVFSDTIETVVFSPFWHVPRNILKGEVLPKLARDPSYLSRENMELVRDGARVDPWSVDLGDPSLRVRQRPGAGNALGQVKFLFPNPHDVYLHDTPADALFARAARSFSHGCVRVEQPYELAQWLLRSQPEWPPQKIGAAMQSGREQHVALAKDVPVHLVYFTVWADDDGTMRYAEDLYGHDARHAAHVPPTWPTMPQEAGQVAQQ